MNGSRRSFFGAAAGAGAALTGTAGAMAAPGALKRKSPSSVEMIEVGIITCGAYTHIEGIWGPFMNPPLNANSDDIWPRTTGMVMTMVWDQDRAVAESFAEKYDVKVVDHFADMVGKVDAIICSGFYECGWWPKLTKPYLEAGIPCLINRPFALSLAEAREMTDRARRHNTPIYAPSPFETRAETLQLRDKVQKIVADEGIITGAFSNQTTEEYPAHGAHGMYGMYRILEPKVKAACFKSETWWDFESGFITWQCEQDDAPDYYVGLNMTWKTPLAWRMILTSQGKFQDDIDWGGGSSAMRGINHHFPLMFEFAQMVETHTMPQSYDYIMGKTEALLTGFYSHCEKNGEMVNISDLPEDWRAPEVKPGLIPPEVFR
jgi:hypothetical protein